MVAGAQTLNLKESGTFQISLHESLFIGSSRRISRSRVNMLVADSLPHICLIDWLYLSLYFAELNKTCSEIHTLEINYVIDVVGV